MCTHQWKAQQQQQQHQWTAHLEGPVFQFITEFDHQHDDDHYDYHHNQYDKQQCGCNGGSARFSGDAVQRWNPAQQQFTGGRGARIDSARVVLCGSQQLGLGRVRVRVVIGFDCCTDRETGAHILSHQSSVDNQRAVGGKAARPCQAWPLSVHHRCHQSSAADGG